MSRAVNLISSTVQVYGQPDNSWRPRFGLSRREVNIPSQTNTKTLLHHLSKRSPAFLCEASSGNPRRNSDFSRQNRHGFSRGRNRHNEERESSNNYEESEFLSTKNGPLLSFPNGPKSQATAAPGPREKEIVELFRKVQAKLRGKMAVKEEKRIEASQGRNREGETVDSLLKLLRKHSVEQGKRKVNGGSGGTSEFNLDKPRSSLVSEEDRNRSLSDSSTNTLPLGRPKSSFRRRSPVPRVTDEPIASPQERSDSVRDGKMRKTRYEPDMETESIPEFEPVIRLDLDEEEQESETESPAPRVRYEPITSHEEHGDFVSDSDLNAKARKTRSGLGPEIESVSEFEPIIGLDLDEEEPKPELNPEPEFESLDTEEVVDEREDTEKQLGGYADLNMMKLAELRALAKARGAKGYSKLKKSELIGLLSEDSIQSLAT